MGSRHRRSSTHQHLTEVGPHPFSAFFSCSLGIHRWLKQSGLDTPTLAHLKRIRRSDGKTTLLLTSVALSPTVPSLPSAIELSEPYMLSVPRNPALTMEALKVKTLFWPTIYAPRKKGELEPLTRGQARWAWEAMCTVVQEAVAAKEHGEVCAHLRT